MVERIDNNSREFFSETPKWAGLAWLSGVISSIVFLTIAYSIERKSATDIPRLIVGAVILPLLLTIVYRNIRHARVLLSTNSREGSLSELDLNMMIFSEVAILVLANVAIFLLVTVS